MMIFIRDTDFLQRYLFREKLPVPIIYFFLSGINKNYSLSLHSFSDDYSSMAHKEKDKVVYFCDGKKCCKYNQEAKDCLKELIEESGLCIALQKMKCQGKCKNAPVFYIEHKDMYKKEVTSKKARKIFEKHLV